MSCTIKAVRVFIYYCATDKLRMLRIERWGQTHKNRLIENGLTARIDESKSAQACINDR